MRSVRLYFQKNDNARFISHLDLMRSVTRTFRRTDIPLWYTEGYNPRVYLVFGLSLPLGAEGLSEPLDIRLTDDDYNINDIVTKMKKVEVPGISIIKAAEPVHKLSEIQFADYSVTVPSNNAEEFDKCLKKIIADGNVIIEKKSKKGIIKSVNVCEHLKYFSTEVFTDRLELKFILPAGNDFNISPLAFCDALFSGLPVNTADCAVTRRKLLLNDLTEFC